LGEIKARHSILSLFLQSKNRNFHRNFPIYINKEKKRKKKRKKEKNRKKKKEKEKVESQAHVAIVQNAAQHFVLLVI